MLKIFSLLFLALPLRAQQYPLYDGVRTFTSSATHYTSGNLCVASSTGNAGTCAININGANGIVTATSFSGNGSGLTNIPAAALASTAAYVTATNTFTSSNTFNGAGGVAIKYAVTAGSGVFTSSLTAASISASTYFGGGTSNTSPISINPLGGNTVIGGTTSLSALTVTGMDLSGVAQLLLSTATPNYGNVFGIGIEGIPNEFFSGSVPGDVMMYAPSTNKIVISGNGTNTLLTLKGANVGINTLTPAAPLDVETQNTGGFSIQTSSGIYLSNGCISFAGQVQCGAASAQTISLNAANTFTAAQTFSAGISPSSITFQGDGSSLNSFQGQKQFISSQVVSAVNIATFTFAASSSTFELDWWGTTGKTATAVLILSFQGDRSSGYWEHFNTQGSDGTNRVDVNNNSNQYGGIRLGYQSAGMAFTEGKVIFTPEYGSYKVHAKFDDDYQNEAASAYYSSNGGGDYAGNGSVLTSVNIGVAQGNGNTAETFTGVITLYKIVGNPY